MTLSLFIPITKVDAAQRLVYGSLASEVVDKTGEMFDYASSKPLVEEWSGSIAKATEGKSVGNLRFMHGKEIAGKFTDLQCNDATKSIDVCAKVVNDDHWKMVEEGCVTGFSIGGSYERRWTDDKGLKRYTAKPSEGSLVDNPANPDSYFAMVKADGTTEQRHFATPAPAAVAAPAVDPAGPKQVWEAKDGKTFATKALAKAHEDEIAKISVPTLEGALAAATAAVAKLEGAAGTVVKRAFSKDERDKAAADGTAMKDGSYPIASKGDLEDAIKAFGRAKNKKAVKAHILSRAKDLGAEGSLPDSWKPTADKALRFGDLRKGLDTVARFACLIQELEWLQQSTEYEADYEQDNSTVPDTLKQNIAALCASLRAMVEEETNELLDEKEAVEFGELLEMSVRTAGVDALAKSLGPKAPAAIATIGSRSLEKAGMRHGKADQANLDQAHDCIKAMGIGKCAGMGDAEKVAKAGARHSKADQDHLQAAHDELTKAGAGCPAKDAPAADSAKGDAKDGDPPEPADKAAPGGDLAKALASNAELLASNTELQKRVDAATTAFTDLATRLTRVESQAVPRPADRVLRIVSKAQDGGALGEDEESLEARLSKLTNEERTTILIKAAHRNAQVIAR